MKPPQEQFWAWLDSFWHKDEPIPQSAVKDLVTSLQKKADLVDGVVPEEQLPFSVVTSEVLSLGKVEVVADKVNLSVHSSGVNKVRVKGQLISRTFPNQWTITPIASDGTKVLRGYAVKNELDFFLAEGEELPNIEDPEIPTEALEIFKITLNAAGSTISVPSSGYKQKQESDWRYVNITDASAPITLALPFDTRGSFYLTKSPGVGVPTIGGIKKVSIAFETEEYFYGGREGLIFNATGGDVILNAVGVVDNSVFLISNRITPFTLKNNTGVKWKLRGSVIELLPSGGGAELPPGTNGQIYVIDNSLPEKIKPSDRLANVENGIDAEIVNRALADNALQAQITAEKNRNDTQDGQIADANIHQITINTTTSITTNTVGSVTGKGQHGRNVRISNGVNAINLTCETSSNADFVASYVKLGSADITFVAGAGVTLSLVDSTALLNGVVGSTACLIRVGNTFYLQISNR